MERSISCGVLVFDAAARLLLCHASGSRYWDIPKGMREGEEPGAHAAAREAAEECGLRLAPRQLRELGRFRYRSNKDLWLFAVLVHYFEARPACAPASTPTVPDGGAPRWTHSAGPSSSSCRFFARPASLRC